MTVAVHQTSLPVSPRLSLSGKLSALGAKIGRMSRSGEQSPIDSDRESLASTVDIEKEQNRSLSRGREAFHSSGRGGLGNFRQTSASRDARPDGPDDFSNSRGREPAANQTKVFSTGRGGAGNIRSPSRDVQISPIGPNIAEEEVIRSHLASAQDAPRSTGRGGVGNIHSRSRSRGPGSLNPHPVHSTGRGGAGNIVAGDAIGAERIDEAERKKRAHNEAIHSTGRGGAANLTSIPGPAIEHPHHAHPGEFSSTGRGGIGNILRGRSGSRDRT